jgi:hypothetical protein
VVTWSNFAQDGEEFGVFARRHDRFGTPLDAADFRVSEHTTSSERSSTARQWLPISR